jgi:hypothetical protein
MIRTPTDLIEELDVEATKFKIVVLVVIFQESGTIYIRSDHSNRRCALTAALARGGEAIGFIGVKEEGDSVLLYRRAFAEYQGKEMFSQYLASISHEVAEMLHQDRYQLSPEWVN